MMVIPAAVDSLLRKQNIEYGVVEPAPGVNPGSVATTLLRDAGEGERVQVLYPASCLLDLNALCRLSGRELRALSAGEVQRLCAQQDFQQVPTLPGAMGLPTLVDRRLLDGRELTLNSGNVARLLQLTGEQFQRSLSAATLGDFAVPLDTLRASKLEQVDDLEGITRAVADFTQLRMRTRLEETLEIPPLPDTAQRIIKLRVDPYADMRALSTIVEMDPALAAQVVSWAASPYYAAPGKIKSVHDAIVRVLGFDLVLNLALGLALGKSLSLPADAPKGFTPYWQQAVYAATAVEALVGCIKPAQRPTIGLAYLSGLLHNFGFLLLAEIFPPHFSTYCRYQEANAQLNYTYIERLLLGITRDQLGSWLMRLWSIPEEVCTGIRRQNEPDYAGPHHAYANLLFVAMRLLRRHGIGTAPLEEIPDEVYQRLNLDPEKALQAIEQVMEASEEIKGIAASSAAA